MRLESVRELKLSIPELLTQRLRRATVRASTRGVAATGLATARAVSRASIMPSYALGITAKGKRNYRLAVRLQHRHLEQGDLVAAIRKEARGEVDVRYIGRVTAGTRHRPRRASRAWYRQRQRPLLCGSSCGVVHDDLLMAGSIGCFVSRRSGGSPMILSNNHVLADEGRYGKGGPILQPGALDSGREPGDCVAALTSFVRLRRPPKANYVDAAVATLDDDVEFDPGALPGIGDLAGLAQDTLDIGSTVHKVGRTTGVRHGRVTAIEIDGLSVEYDTGVANFDNQIEIEGIGASAFSDSGDSGSLIIDDNLMAAGLLFSGSDEGGSNGRGLTFANRIDSVLSRMRLRLLH